MVKQQEELQNNTPFKKNKYPVQDHYIRFCTNVKSYVKTFESPDNTCPFCKKKFLQKFSLRIHVRDIHNQYIQSCRKCNKGFHSSRELKIHIEEEHLSIFRRPIKHQQQQLQQHDSSKTLTEIQNSCSMDIETQVSSNVSTPSYKKVEFAQTSSQSTQSQTDSKQQEYQEKLNFLLKNNIKPQQNDDIQKVKIEESDKNQEEVPQKQQNSNNIIEELKSFQQKQKWEQLGKQFKVKDKKLELLLEKRNQSYLKEIQLLKQQVSVIQINSQNLYNSQIQNVQNAVNKAQLNLLVQQQISNTSFCKV